MEPTSQIDIENKPKIPLMPDALENASELRQHVEKAKTDLLNADKPRKKRGRPPKKSVDGFQSTPQAMPGLNNMPDLKPTLKAVVGLPFNIVADKSNWEGFQLTEPENELLASQLDNILKIYFPQLSSSHAAITLFLVSLSVTAGNKYYAFNNFIKAHPELILTNNKKENDVPAK